MLETKCRSRDEEIVIPMWERIFRLNEPVCREWCLEFYSSLQVDDEFNDTEIQTKKLIHFRCGGKQRHCTIAEFGYLTGMFTRSELDESGLYQFLEQAVVDTSRFSEGLQEEF